MGSASSARRDNEAWVQVPDPDASVEDLLEFAGTYDAYAFSADLEDDAVVHIFEEWESQEALDFHFKTPHMAEFQAKIGTLGVKDMKLKKYEVASIGSVF